MSNYDDPRLPSVQRGRPTAGPLSDNYVPAERDGRMEIMPAAPRDVIQYMPPAVANTDGAWQSPESVSEVGSPATRAWATVIRGAPLLLLAIPAAWGLAWATGAGWAAGVLLFAGLAVAAYLFIVLLDLQHNSPFSTERFRIARAAELKRQELTQEHELRRAALEAYLRHLDGDGGGHG